MATSTGMAEGVNDDLGGARSGRDPELTALALWSTCTPASTLFLALGDKAGGVEVLELRRPAVAQGPQGGASHAGAHCKVFQLRWVARCGLPRPTM